MPCPRHLVLPPEPSHRLKRWAFLFRPATRDWYGTSFRPRGGTGAVRQEFDERLHADLQAKGVRCWFAPHDIQGGRKIHEQIDEAIRLHDRLLLILSEHSMSSEWVKTEIAKARKREVKEGKRVLFPVRLVGFETLRDWECFDGDTGKDSAREIREYFIPDFSNWKDHDSYQRAFRAAGEGFEGRGKADRRKQVPRLRSVATQPHSARDDRESRLESSVGMTLRRVCNA